MIPPNKEKETKAEKRHKKILSFFEEKEKLRVTELSRLLHVTEETIRRDLEILEENNHVIRVRGGAIEKQSEGFETPSLERGKKYLSEKNALAKKACELVNDGEIIAIDASTTCLQIAKHIADKPLTVITNSIQVSIELAKKQNITVILTGGYLRQESMSLVGVSSDKIMNDYHIDKFFISCTAIDSTWGVSDSHELQAKTKQRIASLADSIIVLADHSKFDQKSLVRWLPLEDISTIITSDSLSKEQVKQYQKKVREVIVVHTKK